MSKQELRAVLDKDGVWERVRGRSSVFLDTSCWVDIVDGRTTTALRVREKLRKGVATGKIFCPLSWGLLEELFKQSGESLDSAARLMGELSLNATFVIRTELYRWELARSVDRLLGNSAGSLSGLFAPPWAFFGSQLSLVADFDSPLNETTRANATAHLRNQLSSVGVVDLAKSLGGSRYSGPPPAYSKAAKDVSTWYMGNKRGLFLEEAGNCFRMYITPALASYPPQVVGAWLEQFSSTGDEEAFFRKALAQLPALHNYVEIMMAVDLQPTRKESHQYFYDNEILVAPLAYADVFVSRDTGMLDTLRSRTTILARTACLVCRDLECLDSWLTDRASASGAGVPNPACSS